MTPAQNKNLVLSAMQYAFGDKKSEDLEQFFDKDYIEHSAIILSIGDGLKSLREFVKNDTSPPQKLDIKRASADEDLVWIHLKYELDGTVYAVVDIWRVENGKIKEHWDVLQDTKEGAQYPNAFF